MPYFDLILFIKMQDLAFKKWVLIFWLTQFLLPRLAFGHYIFIDSGCSSVLIFIS